MAGSKKTEYEIAIEVGGKVAASFNNSMKQVNSGFDAMAKQADNSFDAMVKQADNSFDAVVKQADNSFATMVKQADNGFDAIVNMAGSAAKMITAALATISIGNFIGDAVETYSEFEQSMANTAAVANATQYEYNLLEDAAREMGKATTKTAAEASDALGYMMLAGWDVNEAISGLEPVLRLAEATQMDLATCSDLVTDSMSALGISVDELSGYLDICTAANNNANTTAEALMEAFIGCGGAAKTIGADLNDTATALGILANNGTKGAEAGTALNSMLVRMTSKDAAITAMKKLGVTAFDDAGKFRGLQNVLVDLQGALSNLTDEEQASYMSKIAGTNYYTQMGYLLDAVGKMPDEELSAWDDLSGKLNDSNGALLNMADTVTDTLQGAFSRLDSAVDDAKISFADAFADDLKDVINDLSAYIPTLTEKFIEFSTKAGPKIGRAFQTVRKGVGEVWEVVSAVGGWLLEHSDGVQMAIVGIGAAIVEGKLVNGIIGVTQAFQNLSGVLTNPWLFVLVGTASAIAGIAMAVKTAEKQAAKSNLAAHFGDIALSMKDVSETAEYIIASDTLSKVYDSLAAFDELDGIADSMQDSFKAMQKMNWKLSIDMALSADETENYKAEIQNYVEQAQAYVEQERYALDINFSTLDNLDFEQSNAVDKIRQFYENKSDELAGIGTKLSECVTKAFEDNFLSLDEANEIAKLQAQMAEIAQGLATSDFDAKLKVMEKQYSGKDLNADSFQALQEELAVQVEAASAAYEEAFTKNVASAQAAYNGGALNEAEYDAAVEGFYQEYLKNSADAQLKALEFQNNTIMKQYGDEVQAFSEHMDSVMAKYSGEDYSYAWEEQTVLTMDNMAADISDSGISDSSKDAVAMLLETMQPAIEQAEQLRQQYEDLGVEVPAALSNAISTTNLLGAMTADHESAWKVVEDTIVNNEDYARIETNLREMGWDLPQEVAKGIESAQTETIPPVIEGLYAFSDEYANEIFSQGFDITADADITISPHYNEMPLNLTASAMLGSRLATDAMRIDSNATGGIIQNKELSWIAEDGPEAIIPLDKSSNALSLWEETGRLLGVFEDGMTTSTGEELYSGLTSYQTVDNHTTNDSTEKMQFVFSPQITITGNADREDIDNALHISMEEFKELMEQYLYEKSRTSFR